MSTDSQDIAALHAFIAKTPKAELNHSIRPWFWGIYYEREALQDLVSRLPETPENKGVRDQIIERLNHRVK